MNKCIPLTLALAGLLSIHTITQAQSDQVYTWTDENGVTHFVDTPPGHPDAVAKEIRGNAAPGSSDVDPVATDDTTESGTDEAGDQTPELSYAQQKREQMNQKRSQRREEQALKDQRCAIARAELENIEPSRRVFYTNDAGETVRMDDEERVKEVERQKQIIAENCN